MRYCAVEDCDRPSHTRGWCTLHYRRWQRTGDPLGVRRQMPSQRGLAVCSVVGCDATNHTRGLCPKHYDRLRRRGDPDAAPILDMTLRDATRGRPPVERFVAHLTAPPGLFGLLFGCWAYRGGTNGAKDYGIFSALKPVIGEAMAHRIAYVLARGPIPEGLTLDHLCRNPPCCNPWHLEAVTHAENVHRGISPAAQNHRKTHCKHGHPLSGDNLRMESGWRRCRTCQLAKHRRYKARLAARK